MGGMDGRCPYVSHQEATNTRTASSMQLSVVIGQSVHIIVDLTRRVAKPILTDKDLFPGVFLGCREVDLEELKTRKT